MSVHRRAAVTNTGVLFPLLESWNPMTKVATIAAEQNKKRILCRISMEVLKKKFRASEENPMQAVAENRSVIREAAKKLIEGRRFEEDGSIVVSAADL